MPTPLDLQSQLPTPLTHALRDDDPRLLPSTRRERRAERAERSQERADFAAQLRKNNRAPSEERADKSPKNPADKAAQSQSPDRPPSEAITPEQGAIALNPQPHGLELPWVELRDQPADLPPQPRHLSVATPIDPELAPQHAGSLAALTIHDAVPTIDGVTGDALLGTRELGAIGHSSLSAQAIQGWADILPPAGARAPSQVPFVEHAVAARSETPAQGSAARSASPASTHPDIATDPAGSSLAYSNALAGSAAALESSDPASRFSTFQPAQPLEGPADNAASASPLHAQSADDRSGANSPLAPHLSQHNAQNLHASHLAKPDPALVRDESARREPTRTDPARGEAAPLLRAAITTERHGLVGGVLHAGQRGSRAAAAHAHDQTHITAAPLSAQLERGVLAALNTQNGTVMLRLHPASLGQVRVQVQLDRAAGFVSAKFGVATSRAGEALSSSIDQLRESLESRGLSLGQTVIEIAPKVSLPDRDPGMPSLPTSPFSEQQPSHQGDGSSSSSPHDHSNAPQPPGTPVANALASSAEFDAVALAVASASPYILSADGRIAVDALA